MFGLVFALSACVTTLPKPPAPEKAEVTAPGWEDVVPAGWTRVLFDSVDGPAHVRKIVGHHQYATYHTSGIGKTKTTRWETHYVPIHEDVCTTPCAVHLRPGEHEMSFQLISDPLRREVGAEVHVSGERMTHRRRIGYFEHYSMPEMLGAGVLGMLGSTFLAVGLRSGIPDDPSPAYLAINGGSLAAVAVSIFLLATNKSVVQEGSYVQWEAEALIPLARTSTSTVDELKDLE